MPSGGVLCRCIVPIEHAVARSYRGDRRLFFLERGKNMHVNIISDTSGLVSEIRDKIDLYFGKCRTYEYKNPSKWHVYNYLLKANLLNEGDDK